MSPFYNPNSILSLYYQTQTIHSCIDILNFIRAFKRSLKLFIIGIIINGGISIGNYQLKYIRIMGYLQRISICYIIGIIIELLLPPLFTFSIALTPTNSFADDISSRNFINQSKNQSPSLGSKSEIDSSLPSTIQSIQKSMQSMQSNNNNNNKLLNPLPPPPKVYGTYSCKI